MYICANANLCTFVQMPISFISVWILNTMKPRGFPVCREYNAKYRRLQLVRDSILLVGLVVVDKTVSGGIM